MVPAESLQSRQFCSFLLILTAAVAAGDDVPLAGELVKAGGVRAGLIVHLGCGDGKLTAALSTSGNFLVHGLATDDAIVKKARASIHALNLYGKRVSVERGSYAQLPYANDLANMVVVDDTAAASGKGLKPAEIYRVLCPGGVLMAGKAGGGLEAKLAGAGFEKIESLTSPGLWCRARKPVPQGFGGWTHWRCGAGDNPVSTDSFAGYPSQLQWIGDPGFTRGHKGPFVALADGGRTFHTHDDLWPFFPDGGSRRTPLIARDGHNGLLLWKRETTASGLERVVAADGRVYTIVESRGPCVALDAGTGEIVSTYKGTEGVERIRYCEGVLLVMKKPRGKTKGFLKAIDTASGSLLWETGIGEAAHDVGDPVRAGDGKVFHHARSQGSCVCRDLRTGRQLWEQKAQPWLKDSFLSMYHGGVAFFMSGKGQCRLHALSAATGGHLWSREVNIGNAYRSHQQLFFIGEGLYVNQRGGWLVLDPRTGEERKTVPRKSKSQRAAHGGGKCTTETATEQFFFKGGLAANVKSGELRGCASLRSGCRPGTIPGNGMLYTFAHDCGCGTTIWATCGLMPENRAVPSVPLGEDRFRKGTAGPGKGALSADDWPMFLHDASRSSASSAAVSAKLTPLWKADVGYEPTAPSVAWNTVFVGTHDDRVRAFDAGSGARRWTFTAGGPVQIAPTLCDGMCLFSSNDGWIYCLNAESGELIWRLHAAPSERKIVAYERVESVWPVRTGVVTHGGVGFACAGRIAELDGFFMVAFELKTGKIVWEKKISSRLMGEMMSAGKEFVYVWQVKAKFWRLMIMQVSQKDGTHTLIRTKTGEVKERLITLGRYSRETPRTRTAVRTRTLGDVRASCMAYTADDTFGATWARGRRGKPSSARLFCKGSRAWSAALPNVRPDALILAGETLFTAGAAWKEKGKGLLMAVSSADGSTLGSWELAAPPVPEGVAAAGGRLYLTTTDGKIHCFGR